MAVELGAGYISLVPSARGFGRSIIREAQSAGSAAGDTASSHFGSRFVAGMGTVAKRAAQALTVGLGAAAFFGIRTAANFEQVEIAFEGILGSADKAKKLIGELRDFAAKTPFEFPNLVKSAQQLLAVGFASEEIVPTMTEIGNVAATLGVSTPEIEGVVRALGQMKGKGKVSAEELRQISEQFPGFSAIKGIAEELGLSVAEVADIMEGPGGLLAVGIDGEKGVRLILDAMEEFPGAAGAMERQSKTLNGVISTFKDTLSTTAIDFITPYLPALSSAVTAFSGFLTETAVPALKKFIDEGVGPLVDKYGPAIADLFSEHLLPTVQGLVSDGLEALSGWWERNGDSIINFFETFGQVAGDALGTVGDWIWQTALPALQGFGEWLIDHEFAIVGAIAAITAGMAAYALVSLAAAAANVIALLPFYLVAAAIGLLAAGLYFAWTRSETFREAIGTLLFALLVAGTAMTDFFRGVWRWADRAWDAISNIIEGIKDVLDLLKKIPDPLGPIGPGDGGIFGWPGPILDDGGVMPGRRGVHYPAWVAGGETVLPTHKTPLPAGIAGGDTNHIYVTQLPGEDSGESVVRGLRKRRLASVA